MKFSNSIKIFALFLLFTLINGCSNYMYNIKYNKTTFVKNCIQCKKEINDIPDEVRYNISRDGLDDLYFITNSKKWFRKTFKNRRDGIAVNVVPKDIYDCSKKELNKSEELNGDLLPPVYLKKLKKNIVLDKNGGILIYLYKLPSEYQNKELEFNVAQIRNRYLCDIHKAIGIDYNRWKLLDMGFFFDSITYQTNLDSLLQIKNKYLLLSKQQQFEITFKQDHSDYDSLDIRPLYDSLNISDYFIDSIQISAYASVEGPLWRNLELQKERALSFIDALQYYQDPAIKKTIVTDENWTEFNKDLIYTPFTYLLDLDRNEIREELKDKQLMADLEPYLQNHRKAICILSLKRRECYDSISFSKLKNEFAKSLLQNDFGQALDIQNAIFNKIRNKILPASSINELEIPQKKEYSLFLNRREVLKYLINPENILTIYNELLALKQYLPNDLRLKYNICVFKFLLWQMGESSINTSTIKNEISELHDLGLQDNLTKRLLINYEIMRSEYFMQREMYKEKDKSLNFIFKQYKNIPLIDSDYLNLVKYFVSYAKDDWALDVLKDKVKFIDVSEDLLFYYLNLTIANFNDTESTEYKTLLLEALRRNKLRFCNQFNSNENGGVTFQMLGNNFLRRIYCNECN